MSQRNRYSNYDNYLAIRMRQLNCCTVKGDSGPVGPIGPKGLPGNGGKGQKGAGHSTGHHLHFGMKNSSDGGEFIDPNDYIDDIKIIRD